MFTVPRHPVQQPVSSWHDRKKWIFAVLNEADGTSFLGYNKHVGPRPILVYLFLKTSIRGPRVSGTETRSEDGSRG